MIIQGGKSPPRSKENGLCPFSFPLPPLRGLRPRNAPYAKTRILMNPNVKSNIYAYKNLRNFVLRKSLL